MFLALTFAAALIVLLAAGAGQYLVWPARRAVGEAPAQLCARNVQIPYGNGAQVRGWLSDAGRGAGVILLLHEMRADRRSMLARAHFLFKQGYSIVAIDLPGHGESDGRCITLGHREAQATGATLDFLHDRFPDLPIAVIGVSLGGAALLLAQSRRQPDAVILESVYPTLKHAAMNRLHANFGRFAPLIAPLMFVQLPLRFGISHRRLRPIDMIGRLGAPVLILGGDQDRETTAAETRALFNAAVGPKELWLIDHAQHQDLHAFASAQYEQRITGFLQRHLRRARLRPIATQAIDMVAIVQPTEKIGIGQ